MNNNDGEKGGLLGKPGTFSRKANVGCLIIIVPFFCFVIWSANSNMKYMEFKGNNSLAQDNLRSVLTACEKYWGNHPTNICSLPTSNKEQLDWGLNPAKVEVSIINGQKGSFIATAKHYKSGITFQIDNNGSVYININDCLLDRNADLFDRSIEELANECQKLKLAEEKLTAERVRMKKELDEREMTRSSDNRFIDYGKGIITDTKTSLMWAKEDSYAALGKCLNWHAASSYVDTLSTGGYTDWRIPTVEELNTILENSKSNNIAYNHDPYSPLHLDPIFADGSAYSFWSSEIDNAGQVSVVYFTHGSVDSWSRLDCVGGVRAVRP